MEKYTYTIACQSNGQSEATSEKQIVYFVKDGPHMAQEPAKWQATVTVFSVWDQQQQVITFNLRDEQ